jgi:hypothetical protein
VQRAARGGCSATRWNHACLPGDASGSRRARATGLRPAVQLLDITGGRDFYPAPRIILERGGALFGARPTQVLLQFALDNLAAHPDAEIYRAERLRFRLQLRSVATEPADGGMVATFTAHILSVCRPEPGVRGAL